MLASHLLVVSNVSWSCSLRLVVVPLVGLWACEALNLEVRSLLEDQLSQGSFMSGKLWDRHRWRLKGSYSRLPCGSCSLCTTCSSLLTQSVEQNWGQTMFFTLPLPLAITLGYTGIPNILIPGFYKTARGPRTIQVIPHDPSWTPLCVYSSNRSKTVNCLELH